MKVCLHNVKIIISTEILSNVAIRVNNNVYNIGSMTLIITHMQELNTNTAAKFKGHPYIIAPFTLHMCDLYFLLYMLYK